MKNINQFFIYFCLAFAVTYTLLSGVRMITQKDTHNDFEFGGVLRPDDKGVWFVYSDKTHSPTNLGHVDNNGTQLIVHYQSPIRLINWASVTSHRQLIEQNIVCGTSVGTADITISCTKDGKLINFNTLRWPSYIWVYIKGQV